MAFPSGETYAVQTPYFAQQPPGYRFGAFATDCGAAIGVSANYSTCLIGVRGATCTIYGLDPTVFPNCEEVIQESQ